MNHVLIRLLGFLRPYKARMALAATSLILSTVFVLIQPKLIGWAVQLGIGENENKRLLFVAAGALLASSIMRGLTQFGQSYVGEWLAQHVAFDIRNAIYD